MNLSNLSHLTPSTDKLRELTKDQELYLDSPLDSKEVCNRNKEVIAESKEHIYVVEGGFILFEAAQREGKSLDMTIWSVDAIKNQRRKIYSTIWLKFKHEKLNFFELKLEENNHVLNNSWLDIDELNFYIDARACMSAINRDFAKWLLQVKKQGCWATGTTHKVQYLELRCKENYDWLINPSVYPKFPKSPLILKQIISNGPLQKRKRVNLPAIDVRPYLGLYNTREVYDPFAMAESADIESTESTEKRVNRILKQNAKDAAKQAFTPSKPFAF